MYIASRISNLGTETAFEVLARARALEAKGKSIVHLEIGEPDFDTPPNIVEAAKRALDDGWTHYGPSAGLPQLREAIADYFNRTRGISKYRSENVVVTPGAKPIIFYGLQATIEPGDEVIYPNPGFPIYESVIRFLGAKPVPLPLREVNQFRIDLDELESLVTARTRMIIINSPHNPTGSVLTQDDLRSIAELAEKYDLLIFSDEIYSRIMYDGVEYHSITELDGIEARTIVLDGFSKTFAMTGWRLGYGLMPATLAQVVARLQTNCTSCAPSFTQIAGIEALSDRTLPHVQRFVEEFRRRRNAIVAGLNSLPGVTCQMPSGAFYAFPNVRGTGMSSQQFADSMLEDVGVACLSGTAFGEHGEGYVRFSYANSLENIESAIERMKIALEQRIIVK
ncbi:MAG: pyridoxal phosphate-dependent aminotransferase [Chlorobi bacterium]|nr:pyridoxal phosphate-dependent aminotransferase [Chlorobiota bacterium]